MKNNHNMNKRNGFDSTESLIALGFLSLLAAIIIPIYQSVRGSLNLEPRSIPRNRFEYFAGNLDKEDPRNESYVRFNGTNYALRLDSRGIPQILPYTIDKGTPQRVIPQE